MNRFRDWLKSPPAGADPSTLSPAESVPPPSSHPVMIVGLGNPGAQYAKTRHNLGFMVIDELVKRTAAGTPKLKNRAEVWETRYGSHRMILVKPQTYMNDSGLSVQPLAAWYKIPLEHVLIVVDDLDQPYEQIRIRAKGSAGGHNGLKSIFRETGTDEIPRLRVGIGRGQHQTIDHVLSRFSAEQERRLPEVVQRAAGVVELWIDRGILEAMNLTNGG